MPAVAELFQHAVQSHQGGNLAQAEALYRQVLQADPAHAEAHHLLGVLAHQTGRHEAAIGLMRQAITLNPGAAAVHFNLGIVHMNLKQFAEAAHCFRQASLGNPGLVEAHVNLGNALMEQGKFAEAIACYQEVLSINPQHAHAHNNLGNAFLGQGQPEQAQASYRRALQYDPANSRAYYNLGNILKDEGQKADATTCYRQAIACQPLYTDAHNNLGIILRDQGQLEEAIQCYRQALRIDPNHAEAWNNLGNALMDQEKPDEAAACYRQAMRIRPTHPAAYNNLGLALKQQALFDEASQCFQQALDIDPNHCLALWNRCLMRLAEGDFERGWQDFDLRWAQPGMMARSFQEPRWDGSSLDGKTILVYAEHGLGDTIQAIRYLPLVKQRGGTLLFECQPVLVKLLAGVRGVDQLIAAGAPLPPFDVQASLLSLPSFFIKPSAAIPANVPYLTANPQLVGFWHQELWRAARRKPAVDSERGVKVVGIAWQGNPTHPKDRERSVPLAQFERLARLKGIQLVSLQIGPGTEQLGGALFPLVDLGSRFDRNSLADVAATIMNLDLVITVDTAVAHVAGALGVPVWVALPLVPDWRWLLHCADSPWYPTMRLFRQNKSRDWSDVFERIAGKITSIIN